MLLDFDVRSCSRCCATTGRTLAGGDVYFSVLEVQGAQLVRSDYSSEAWQDPPEECLGWWRSRIPTKEGSKPKLAPNDVMLNLFIKLADQPAEADFRFLLGLLLVRRRVFRNEDRKLDEQGREILELFCPRRNEHYELLTVELDQQRSEQVQQRMVLLLYGDGETRTPEDDKGQEEQAADTAEAE